MTAAVLLLLLKVTAVLVAALLASLSLRRASASARHAVWMVSLASLLLLPALTHVLPRWDVAVLPPSVSPASSSQAALAWTEPPASTETAEPVPPAAIAPPTPATHAGLRVDGGTWIAAVWLGGAVFGLVHLALGTLLIALKSARAASVDDERWRGPLEDAARRMRLRRRVALCRSDDVAVPIVWGWRRPVILIPADADSWPPERRQAFLVHELAHVVRHDCLTQTLASIAHSLYWPHPLAWWAMSRLRREAERACDDRVLAAGTTAPDYAHHLLEAARGLQDAPRRFAPASAVVERTSLGDRLLALLDDRLNRRAVNRRVLAAAGLLAFIVTGAVAMMQPVARAAVAEVVRAAVALPAAAPAAPEPAATATPRPRALATAQPAPQLKGIVKGPDGKPVEKALVIAWEAQRANEPPLITRTDASGEFEIAVSAPGVYRLRVEAPPLAPHAIEKIGTRGILAVKLLKGATIEGVVRDGSTRRPIARARVIAREPDARVPEIPAERDAGQSSAISDKDGRYRVEGLPRGTIQVSAVAPGYSRSGRSAVAGSMGVDLFIDPGASLTGVVKGADGRPVSGATIDADCEVPFCGTVPAVTTDAQGRFEVHGLEAGHYRLLARHASWAPALVAGIPAQLGSTPPVDVRLEKGYRVQGRLVGAEARAVRGQVALQAMDGVEVPGLLSRQIRGKAESDGRFRIDGLPPGAHTLAVWPLGYAATQVEVHVGGKEPVVDVGDVRLEAGLHIRGRVRAKNGQPVAGASVSTSNYNVSRSGHNMKSASTESETDGSFMLAGLEKGLYRVRVRAEGYASLISDETEPGARPLDLVLEPAAKIVGMIVDDSQQPVRDCRVLARAGPRGEGVSEATTVVGAGGRFEIGHVSPGTYVVEVQASDYVDATVSDVKVETGRTIDVGRVVLQAGGRVTGTVVDGQGSPVAGASVQPQLGRTVNYGGGAGARQAHTDAAGRFELRGLPAGPTQFRARHRRFASSMPVEVNVDPAAGPAEVSITLNEGGRLTGTVRRRDGTPPAGMFVAVTGGAGFHGSPVNATVNADGTFVAEHVSPGKGKAMLMAGSAGRYNNVLSKDIEIRDGDTTHVELVLTDVLVSGRVTRGGKPVANHRLTLSTGTEMVMASGNRLGLAAPAAGPARLTAVTGADGHYELLVSKPDKYAIRLESLGREKSGGPSMPSLIVPDVETFRHDIALPEWALSGTVVDKESGKPLAEARVDVRPAGGEPGGATMTTAADGRFQLAAEPGVYVVRVIAPGHQIEEDTLTFTGASVERTFELTRGGALKGFVRTSGGQGVEGVTVVALAPDGDTVRTARTLVDGSFAVDGLPAGTYQLFAGHSAGFGAQSRATLGEPADLVLAPGSKVRLLFKDEKGALLPETSVRVELLSVGGTRVGVESKGAYGRASAQTDRAGTLELPLPMGDIGLVAWATDKKLRAEAQVSVQAQTPDVALNLKPRR